MTTRPFTGEDLTGALPDTSATRHLKGLDSALEIYRDAYGIPHVRARSFADAFFGQGYATAQDRLWHMDHDRRFAYGRWAEYGGPAAVPQDTLMRRLQVFPSVEADYQAVNDETRGMLDSFAAGVNAFIDGADPLPIEYVLLDATPEPWLARDCLAVFKARHILMGVFESKIWRARLVNELGPQKAAQVLPSYPTGHLLIIPPGAEYLGGNDGTAHLMEHADSIGWMRNEDAGSNNWAVSGSRTASGSPLLAGDPHRPLDTPNVYYQNHIACPEFDAVGLSFPGFPGFPHFGHNAQVAWCVTHAQADYQDLYIERFKEGPTPLYEHKGEWLPADIRREVILVRGAKPVEVDVAVTRHGPVIAGGPASGHGVAFKYTGTDGPNLGFQALPRMLRATSADEIEESMREWVDPSNNFVYADVQGNIGYLNRGRLPIRSAANAWLPVPGWTGEHEWRGFVPFEDLARSRNPSTGYIVTANNRIVGEDYPHYVGLNFSPEHRARRITDRLKELGKATVQDMAAIHSERVSIPGRTYARLLSTVRPQDELSSQAQRRLSGWEGSMDRDAVEPAIYSAFRLHLNRRLVQHALGPVADDALGATGRGAPLHLRLLEASFVQAAEKGDTSVLPPDTDWDSLLARALAEGVAYLKDRLGDDIDQWTWGKVHSTRPRHLLSEQFPDTASLLDPPSVLLGGDGDTPLAASYLPSAPFSINTTSISRYVFDTSDWDNSAWIIPLGASGHPGSPHYADQTPIWSEMGLIPMLYDWDRIAATAESRQELRKGD